MTTAHFLPRYWTLALAVLALSLDTGFPNPPGTVTTNPGKSLTSTSSVPALSNSLSAEVTFNNNIAPIIFARCAPCHHPGQPAPFPLLSYRDVSRRAPQILRVTETGYMPPWLPETGFGDFANERRLTIEEKRLLAQWVADGAVQGAGQAPEPPQFQEGWILGKPDLVVTMPEEFELGAEGADIYRNFVLPVPLATNRYVRALEFAPGNSRIVHHAFIKLDKNRSCRIQDAQDPAPGFPGMNVQAEMPAGQFLCWQPGKLPSIAPDGLAWELPANSDLILQAHLNRTGKRETFRPSVGLYFTNARPSRTCVKVSLVSLALNIPAGESSYKASDSLLLPVDADVLSILPHAHYLAREIKGFARLPDGTTNWLVYIKKWDFRWQGDYQYEHPVHLPKGSILQTEFLYDNSTNNPSNPNPVPKRVLYGPQSSDEMCELWLQLVVSNARDAADLKSALNAHLQECFRSGAVVRLAIDPNHVESHLRLARILFTEGNHPEALAHLRKAAQLDPELDTPHYELGVIYRSENRVVEALQELQTALRLNPINSKAFGHLGFVHAQMGEATKAEQCFTRCLELDPNDEIVREGLKEIREFMAKHPQ